MTQGRSCALLATLVFWTCPTQQVTAQTTPQPYDVLLGGFAPTGWMGDGEVKGGFVTEVSRDRPHSGPTCAKWTYAPKGKTWGAVAYQFPPENWGDVPGRNLAGKGYTEVSVWARGVPDSTGRMPVIQFKAGAPPDKDRKYKSSFDAPENEFVTLTRDWQRYTVSLAKKNLANVISAFTFVLPESNNPNGAVFFLSEIEYR